MNFSFKILFEINIIMPNYNLLIILHKGDVKKKFLFAFVAMQFRALIVKNNKIAKLYHLILFRGKKNIAANKRAKTLIKHFVTFNTCSTKMGKVCYFNTVKFVFSTRISESNLFLCLNTTFIRVQYYSV